MNNFMILRIKKKPAIEFITGFFDALEAMID